VRKAVSRQLSAFSTEGRVHHCHAERSEASPRSVPETCLCDYQETLRYAQGDSGGAGYRAVGAGPPPYAVLRAFVPSWFCALCLRHVVVLLTLVLALTPALALANGGTIQVSNQRAGPYVITVFTEPTPIRVGVVDVSVLLQREVGSEVVRGAQVTVVAEPVGHQAAGGSYEATHERATNRLYYAADVSLPEEGQWRLTVRVAGELGEGEVSFEVEASHGSLLDTPLLLALLAAPPGLLLLWWFFRSNAKSSRG
jgi:hypothetical protein